MLIRGLWEIHTDAIVDFIFIDTDADTYLKEVRDNILHRWEQMKKYKHG